VVIADEYPTPGGPNGGPDEGESELARRLRELRWPEVSPEVRQRCWEELSQQVSDLGDPSPGAARPVDALARVEYRRARQRRFWGRDNPDGPGGRRFGRHDFAGHAGESLYSGGLTHRVAVARGAAGVRPG
jgi:hypothetical protein